MRTGDISLENADSENPELNIDTQKEGAEDYQRYITDIGGIELIFNRALCGWRPKRQRGQALTILGEKAELLDRGYEVDKRQRFINEAGSRFLAHSLYGLISQLTSTSKLSEMQIYTKWNGYADVIRFTLLSNYYEEGNTFQIDINNLITLCGFVYSFQTITFKAIDGFTLHQITETIMSLFRQNSGAPELPQKKHESIFSKLLPFK